MSKLSNTYIKKTYFKITTSLVLESGKELALKAHMTEKFENCAPEIQKFTSKYIWSIKIARLISRLRDTNFPDWKAHTFFWPTSLYWYAVKSFGIFFWCPKIYLSWLDLGSDCFSMETSLLVS